MLVVNLSSHPVKLLSGTILAATYEGEIINEDNPVFSLEQLQRLRTAVEDAQKPTTSHNQGQQSPQNLTNDDSPTATYAITKPPDLTRPTLTIVTETPQT